MTPRERAVEAVAQRTSGAGYRGLPEDAVEAIEAAGLRIASLSGPTHPPATPAEHYRRAQDLIAAAGELASDGDHDGYGLVLAEAQVHATLATADRLFSAGDVQVLG